MWNFGLGNPLSVQSLMSCCRILEDDAESSAEDRGLACEVSKTLLGPFMQ